MMDFEKACINAFNEVLSAFDVRNCYFHLCQSIQRKVFETFKKRYFVEKDFARASRLVAFLAFVPIEHVEETFVDVTVYISANFPRLMVVLNYFEATYLGQVVPETDI